MKNTFALIVAASFSLLTACKTTAPDDALAYTSGPGGMKTPHWYAESTSAMITATGPRTDGDCMNGRLVIASGSGAAGDPGTPAIILRDLNDTTTVDPAPLDHSVLEGVTATNDYLQISGDHVLVRRKNGDLVLVWAAMTWRPFPNGKPAWGDYLYTNGHKGVRAGLFSWTSSDCGKSWKALTLFDSGDSKVVNGDTGWPRATWFGGFDREEVYADPFSGNVYLTTSSRSGGHPDFPQFAARSHMLLLVLKPDATAWHVLVARDSSAAADNNFDSISPPVEMTTTEQGRLYMAQCNGITPVLYWMDAVAIAAGKSTLSGKLEIPFGPLKGPLAEVNKCATLPGGSIAGNFDSYYASWPLISRWYSGPAGGVRIAYPAISDGRQVVQIMGINDTGGPKIDVTSLATLDGGSYSILQGAFIENDPTEFRGKTDITAMYWLEGDKDELRASYTFFRAPFFDKPKVLSTKSGQPYTWVPKLYGNWAGDYVKGASAYDGTAFNYFMQWPESEAGVATPNLNLHYRILKAKQ
ncbi:MAG: hypothetical protein QOC81_3630 [Thermoanaerobaculia bacterium]|jgi:hypothetical protein|nr:hypothetical protein [Thermoanaerobaculia bacterium]